MSRTLRNVDSVSCPRPDGAVTSPVTESAATNRVVLPERPHKNRRRSVCMQMSPTRRSERWHLHAALTYLHSLCPRPIAMGASNGGLRGSRPSKRARRNTQKLLSLFPLLP